MEDPHEALLKLKGVSYQQTISVNTDQLGMGVSSLACTHLIPTGRSTCRRPSRHKFKAPKSLILTRQTLARWFMTKTAHGHFTQYHNRFDHPSTP